MTFCAIIGLALSDIYDKYPNNFILCGIAIGFVISYSIEAYYYEDDE